MRFNIAIVRDLGTAGGYLAAGALCTVLAYQLGAGLATAGFLYLIVVTLTAVYEGFWTATTISLAAVCCLNLFFVPPLFSFAVESPGNWVALGAFEFTALVTSRLSHTAQVRAKEALAERRDSERLYLTSCRILLMDRSRDPGPLLPGLIREGFDLDAAILFDARSVSTYISGGNPPGIEQRTRDAYCLDKNDFDPEGRFWFSPLHLGARPIGGLGLSGSRISPLVATALASLCAIALERARSLENECRAEAAREGEQLRAAVLDALGHEFKTPVTVIWTASSGLLAAGELSSPQTELLAIVNGQAEKLNDLASRLLRTARLDSAAIKPRRTRVLFSNVVRAVIEALDTAQSRERFHVSASVDEMPVLADRKLLSAALAQLIDNAIRYSFPASPIDVGLRCGVGETILSVRTQGLVIKPSDRERIFARFYRTPEAKNGPAGTGLGLSIVKRIVEAHDGHVWVQSEPESGTTFSLALPAAR